MQGKLFFPTNGIAKDNSHEDTGAKSRANEYMTVNGKQVDLKEIKVRSLLELIMHYSLQPEAIAVERNGEVPPREKWGEIYIHENDRIELIRFVGGG